MNYILFFFLLIKLLLILIKIFFSFIITHIHLIKKIQPFLLIIIILINRII